MKFAALIPLGLFVLVLTGVGLRLLGLARRTREWPEFVLGSGLLLVAFVGMPLAAVGRAPGTIGTPLGHTAFAVGITVVIWGIGHLYVFTWRVFRASSVWAMAFVVICCIAMAVIAGAISYQSSLGTTIEEILPRTRSWSLGIMGMVALQFVWSGVESASYYKKSNRRLILGLADAVVVNRFLLWSISSAAAASLCGGLAICAAANMVIMQEMIPLCIISSTGLVTSVSWYLTFFPPQAYQDFLRRRAAARR